MSKNPISLRGRKTPRHVFEPIADLFLERHWLAARKHAVLDLVQLCSTTGQQNLLFDLLMRLYYLTNDDYDAALQRITTQIFETWALPPSATQLVATAGDSHVDSSKEITYRLRTFASLSGLSTPGEVDNFQRAQRQLSAYPNVVLVDEFLGSGQSLHGRITKLRQQIQDATGQKDYPIYVAVVAAMQQGKTHVALPNVTLYADETLHRGISDTYSEPERSDALAGMDTLEQELSPYYNGHSLPKLGYRKCEALYGRANGNVPNNVFPIFWWPTLRDGSGRALVLNRAL